MIYVISELYFDIEAHRRILDNVYFKTLESAEEYIKKNKLNKEYYIIEVLEESE